MSDLEKEMKAWMKENIQEYVPKIKPEDLPSKFILPNPRNIPIKNQGNTSGCPSHGLASTWEYTLSNHFNELVIVDAKDLWEKLLKYGTATKDGDTFIGAAFVADKYGMKFETKSGIQGIFRPSKGIEITYDPADGKNES